MLCAKILFTAGAMFTAAIGATFCFSGPHHGQHSRGPTSERRAAINRSLDLYAQAGNTLEVEKNPRKAEVLFRQALALNPSNPFLKQGLGEALSSQGNTRQALVAYRESIHPTGTSQSTESDPLTLNRYRELCKAVGDARESAWAERQIALQAYRMFNEYPHITEDQLASLPVSTMAKLAVGLAHHRLGEDAKALNSFTEAVREKPRLALAHLYRAQSLERKLGFGVTEAQAEYKKAYQLGDANVRTKAQERLKGYLVR